MRRIYILGWHNGTRYTKILAYDKPFQPRLSGYGSWQVLAQATGPNWETARRRAWQALLERTNSGAVKLRGLNGLSGINDSPLFLPIVLALTFGGLALAVATTPSSAWR